MFALLVAVASAQTVTTSGACSGEVTVNATNLRKHGGYALLVGEAFGEAPVAVGRCEGIPSGLATVAPQWKKRARRGELVHGWVADPKDGEDGCVAHLQLLDLKTCELSNAVRLPPPGWEQPVAFERGGALAGEADE